MKKKPTKEKPEMTNTNPYTVGKNNQSASRVTFENQITSIISVYVPEEEYNELYDWHQAELAKARREAYIQGAQDAFNRSMYVAYTDSRERIEEEKEKFINSLLTKPEEKTHE